MSPPSWQNWGIWIGIVKFSTVSSICTSCPFLAYPAGACARAGGPLQLGVFRSSRVHTDLLHYSLHCHEVPRYEAVSALLCDFPLPCVTPLLLCSGLHPGKRLLFPSSNTLCEQHLAVLGHCSCSPVVSSGLPWFVHAEAASFAVLHVSFPCCTRSFLRCWPCHHSCLPLRWSCQVHGHEGCHFRQPPCCSSSLFTRLQCCWYAS